METINKKDLMPILQQSILVNQFEDDMISIPKKYVLNHINVKNYSSFSKTMDILRYYMVKELPYEIYDYVLKNKPNLFNFKDFFFEKLKILKQINSYDPIIKHGSLKYFDLTKYLHENGYRFTSHACSWAVIYGNLDCLKYLRSKRYNWNSETCSSAARAGNLNCLKYLHENGCGWTSYTCSWAAKYGHLDCLKYVHENGCRWEKDACRNAAKNNQLHCLKYLHENGCPWSTCTCFNASRYGNLDCLKYAIKNGCPYDKQTCIHEARKKNHTNIINYLENK